MASPWIINRLFHLISQHLLNFFIISSHLCRTLLLKSGPGWLDAANQAFVSGMASAMLVGTVILTWHTSCIASSGEREGKGEIYYGNDLE